MAGVKYMDQQTEDLITLRADFQAIDQQILEMIATRRTLSERIAGWKAREGFSIRDFPSELDRLGFLIEKGKALGIDAFSVSKFYQSFIEDSVMTQCATLYTLENNGSIPEAPAVAFLGGEGSYSQLAAKKYFSFANKPITELGHSSFPDLLQAVVDEEADFAVLPFINSTTGLITDACNALLACDVSAVGEIFLPIEHCLLGKNWNYPTQNIKAIYAHPQVFAQCRPYLASLEQASLVPCTSTTEALTRLCEGPANQAAIGSSIAGNIFGLKVLKSNLQGDQQNFTRFLVLGKTPQRVPKQVGAKTTLALTPKANATALSEILLEFSDRDINASLLEALPSPGGLWDRVYLLDVEERLDDSRLEAALNVIETKTLFMKVLGHYPSARISSFFGN